MVHGYGAAQGFFFRNLDALADHFKVIAIDQLG
jgi:pimeloyl-ACP methyl ester carboxylesterase